MANPDRCLPEKTILMEKLLEFYEGLGKIGRIFSKGNYFTERILNGEYL